MISDRKIGAWWAEYVNECPLWRTADLPDPSFKQRLLAERLAIEVRRDLLCLCTPDKSSNPREFMLAHFWEIVSAILQPYAPYALQGPTALNAHFADWSVPSSVWVATARSRTRIALLEDAELVLDRETSLFSSPGAIEALPSPAGCVLQVECPESALIRLRPRHMRSQPDLVMAFLKSAEFNCDRLAALSQSHYRPAKFKKLANWCAQLDRPEVATVLRAGRTPPTRKPIAITAPASLVKPARPGQSAYVTRLLDHLRLLRDALDEHLEYRFDGGLTKGQVLAIAEEEKKLDTYHSSTIEGYRVSPEEIDILIGGAPAQSDESREQIERRMALLGYLAAHRFTLQQVTRLFAQERVLSERLVQDLHAELFKPTVDAGLLSAQSLRLYRNIPVYIRNSRFVPPNWQKLGELMQSSVDFINDVDGFATRAVLIHYAFVTIHPYTDGNGRTARLLMNFALATAGAPWVTIRIEDRDVYFRALQEAQCDSTFDGLISLFSRYFTEPARRRSGPVDP